MIKVRQPNQIQQERDGAMLPILAVVIVILFIAA